MRLFVLPLLAAPFVVALGCGTPGGKSFVRAYAAGDRAYSSGRYLEAASAYEAAAGKAERPRDKNAALFAAAVAHERAGDLDGALARYERLAQEDPDGERSTRAAFEAATIRLRRGDTERGIAALLEILRKAPEHGIARRALRITTDHVAETKGAAAAIAHEEELAKTAGRSRLGEEICYDLAKRREALGDPRAALAGFLRCAETWPYPHGALWDDALWHAARLHEALGDPRAAIATLERILAERETSYMNGSYNRPRMAAAQFRIAEITRDALGDRTAARRAFRKVHDDHPSSILRARALHEEGLLARAAGDGQSACATAALLLDKFAESRFARRADELCPEVRARAEELRSARERRRPRD
jgi:tetratricopeptide (TPR) repeat protein